MLDKKTLNNEIVAMRKVVKQAKVHVINKLSREIKKLRLKSGSDTAKAKSSRRADRKRDEIFIIKKLNLDDISKFVLKNEADPMKKIENPSVGLERRAYFRFAAHKLVSAKVQAFRQQFPEWKNNFYELLEGLGARRKKEPKDSLDGGPSSSQKIPPMKKDKDSENEEDESPLPNVQTQEKIVSKKSPLKVKSEADDGPKVSPKVDFKSRFSSQWSVEEIKQEVEENSVDGASISTPKQIENVNGSKVEKELVESVKSGAAKYTNPERRKSAIAEVKRFSALKDDEDSLPEKPIDAPVKEEVDSEEDQEGSDDDGQGVDPFFVKADGKTEYVTKIVVSDEEEDGGRKSPPFMEEGGSSRGGMERNSRGGRGGFHGDRGGSGRGRGSHGGEKPWSKPSRGGWDRGSGGESRGRGDSNFRGRSRGRGDPRGGGRSFNKDGGGPPGESAVNLHPSWEAKRKQNDLGISKIAFQGKKIKFDDDD